MTPTDLIQQSTTQLVVRRQTFKVRTLEGICTILDRLLSQRHTGVISIVTSQGGILELSAEDKFKLPEKM